jgi:hypothetical protein
VSEALRTQPYVPKTNITTKVEPAPRLGRFDAELQKTATIAGFFPFSRDAGFPVEPPVPPGEFLIFPALSLGGDVRYDLFE